MKKTKTEAQRIVLNRISELEVIVNNTSGPNKTHFIVISKL